MTGGRTVRLLNVPSALFVQNVILLEDLLQEIRVVQVGHETGQVPVPPETAARMTRIFEAYGATRHAMCEQAQQAAAAGRDRLDIELRFAPHVVSSARELADLTEQADAMARRLHLLTVAAPPEIVELRRWISEQIERQLERGEPPEPFPG